ncbi:MAG: hypothetical protein ACRYG7_41060 [Janthinobacterium lividum]
MNTLTTPARAEQWRIEQFRPVRRPAPACAALSPAQRVVYLALLLLLSPLLLLAFLVVGERRPARRTAPPIERLKRLSWAIADTAT